MTRLITMSALVLAGGVLAVVPPAQAGAPTCQGQRATIVGTAHADQIRGTPGRDVIVARGGDDGVDGRGGDDLICGGEGADHLRGGAGADRLYGQTEHFFSDRGGRYFVSDILDGGAGADLLDVGGDGRDVDWGNHGALDFSGAAGAVRVDLEAGTAAGYGADTIVDRSAPVCEYDCFGITVLGTDGPDQLLGGPNNDELFGFEGDDVIDGRGGNDLLRAESDSDTPQPVPDSDTLTGGPGDDRLVASVGADTLHGDAGADNLWSAGNGPAQVFGGEGDDRVALRFPKSPGFVLDGGEGVDAGQVLAPRRVGLGGRPEAMTWDAATAAATAPDDVVWGLIGTVEELLFAGGIDWTCTNADGIDVEGCA